MSSLPSEFVGLWERVALLVAGGPVAAGRSYWFQAESQLPNRPVRGGHARDRGWAWVFGLVMGLSLGLATEPAPTGGPFQRYGFDWTL